MTCCACTGPLLSELTDRGMLRSRNAPAGDLAEHPAAVVCDGVLAPASEKSWDVRDRAGRTVQVKCRVQGDAAVQDAAALGG